MLGRALRASGEYRSSAHLKWRRARRSVHTKYSPVAGENGATF